MSDQLVLSLWRGLIKRPRYTVLPRDIVREVAERRGFTVADIQGPSISRPVAQARQEVMYELRRRTTLSYPQIARLCGRQDHTTAMHGERRHADRLEGRA